MAILTRVRGALLLAVCAAWLAVLPAGAQDVSGENSVKAAYLYNFTKFVEWPPAALPGDRFRICVVGDRAFSEAVEGIVRGESAYGRPLARVEPQTVEDARTCQILYVSRLDPERGNRMLAAVRQLPVLTVSDAPRFLDQGGAIRFVLVDGRMRFDIAVAATDRAGLRVSSKLLRVARELGEAP